MFDLPAASVRWERVREMMDRLDLDLLLAIDLSRDEILLRHPALADGLHSHGGSRCGADLTERNR